MPDPFPLDSNELTPEDLDVIRGFLAADVFAMSSAGGSAESTSSLPEMPVAGEQAGALDESGEEDEMLAVFATEVDEDLAGMRQALALLRQEETPGMPPAVFPTTSSPAIAALRRGAHKIRGTSAAVGCKAMPIIAYAIETLLDQAHSQPIEWTRGLLALGYALDALRETLESVVVEGVESIQPLMALEERFSELQLPLRREDLSGSGESERDEAGEADFSEMPAELMGGGAYERVEGYRLEQLLLHVEQLTGQQREIETVRRDVEAALGELRMAQARLHRLEVFVAAMPVSPATHPDRGDEGGTGLASIEQFAPSSLVARILREANQRTGHAYQPRVRALVSSSAASSTLAETMAWDELELDNFTESQVLARSVNEAVADVTTATTQLQLALAQLDTLLQQQASRAVLIRDDALALHLQGTPGSLRRVREATRGLLLRAGEQQVIVPFSQVLRIDYAGQFSTGQVYALSELLGIPSTSGDTMGFHSPLLILRESGGESMEGRDRSQDERIQAGQVAVRVDEALGEVEWPVKLEPPPPSLWRPGITGTTSTLAGEVALVLDLPLLIRWYEQRWASRQAGIQASEEQVARQNGQNAQDAQQVSAVGRYVEQAACILVVDDSVYIRRTLSQTLSAKGYRLLEARDGIEALEQLTRTSPDVLLLDLEMPNLNGYELLKILRARCLLPNLRIILLTTRSSEKHRQRAQELGIHAYLTKPCSEEKLLETVTGVLGQR
jgi:CheY-like chemotaxis protein